MLVAWCGGFGPVERGVRRMADVSTRRLVFRAGTALLITGLAFAALGYLDPGRAYHWVKALHIIAVISWMAGMLYLPRLFVNHVGLPKGSAESELLKGMEQRLLRIIVNPAMVVTWASGLWLAWYVFRFEGGWLHAKLAAVLLLSAVHGFFSRATRDFSVDRNVRSAKFWRIVNEVPALLMVAIVILVVVKPF